MAACPVCFFISSDPVLHTEENFRVAGVLVTEHLDRCKYPSNDRYTYTCDKADCGPCVSLLTN